MKFHNETRSFWNSSVSKLYSVSFLVTCADFKVECSSIFSSCLNFSVKSSNSCLVTPFRVHLDGHHTASDCCHADWHGRDFYGRIRLQAYTLHEFALCTRQILRATLYDIKTKLTATNRKTWILRE